MQVVARLVLLLHRHGFWLDHLYAHNLAHLSLGIVDRVVRVIVMEAVGRCILRL